MHGSKRVYLRLCKRFLRASQRGEGLGSRSNEPHMEALRKHADRGLGTAHEALIKGSGSAPFRAVLSKK